MIKVTENKDSALTLKLAKKFHTDLHAIDKIVKSWVANENKKDIGILGVCKWDKNYGIVDLLGLPSHIKPEKVADLLVKHLISIAKKDKVNKIYCHMGEEKIKFFLNNNFTKIKEIDLPMGYFCACTQCPQKDVTCFPKPILWKKN